MGDTVIAQGDMYLAARQSGREDIQVLLYHYDACFDTLFEGGSRVEEQAPFVELMKDHDYNREVTLSVRGMTGGSPSGSTGLPLRNTHPGTGISPCRRRIDFPQRRCGYSTEHWPLKCP